MILLFKLYLIFSLIGIIIILLSLPFLNKVTKKLEYLEDIERRNYDK